MAWNGDGKEEELFSRYAKADEDMGPTGKRKGNQNDGEQRKKDPPGLKKEKEGQRTREESNEKGGKAEGNKREEVSNVLIKLKSGVYATKRQR